MGIRLKDTARGISSKASEDIPPSSKGTVMGLRKAGDMVGVTAVGMEAATDNHRGEQVAEVWEWRAERHWV